MGKRKLGAAIVFVSILIFTGSVSAFSFGLPSSQGKAAVIPLTGAIQPTSSGMSSDTITPEKVRRLNSKAMQKNPDAVVYEINSGGGAVVASKEVMNAIDSVDVPTVCRFRDVGASGAYLAALGCDRIVADSATLTGSIGVRSSFMEFSGTLDRLGIEYINITAGEQKDLGSPYRNVTDAEKKKLKQQAETIHREFIEAVDEDRNLSDQQLEKVATGEPFLGERAKELGLVDRLGGRQVAYNEAENLTGKDLRFEGVELAGTVDLFSLLDLPFAGIFQKNSAFVSSVH